jgi:hypothetical protein
MRASTGTCQQEMNRITDRLRVLDVNEGLAGWWGETRWDILKISISPRGMRHQGLYDGIRYFCRSTPQSYIHYKLAQEIKQGKQKGTNRPVDIP